MQQYNTFANNLPIREHVVEDINTHRVIPAFVQHIYTSKMVKEAGGTTDLNVTEEIKVGSLETLTNFITHKNIVK